MTSLRLWTRGYRYYSVLSNLISRCSSCGIKLQSVDKGLPGYYIKGTPKRFRKYEDEVYGKYISGLSAEDRRLLGVGVGGVGDTVVEVSGVQGVQGDEVGEVGEVQGVSGEELGEEVGDVQGEVVETVEVSEPLELQETEVVETLEASESVPVPSESPVPVPAVTLHETHKPPNNPKTPNKTPKNTHYPEKKECIRCRDIKYRSKFISEPIISPDIESYKRNAIYVINSMEFPLNLNRKILNSNPIVIITKCDLINKSYETLMKFPFFKEYLNRNYNVDPSRVFYVSSHKNWGIDIVSSYISSHPNTYYVLGDVNSGKSSFISRLMFYKNQDFRVKFDTWTQNNGPGISNLPGFTRGELEYDLGRSGSGRSGSGNLGSESLGHGTTREELDYGLGSPGLGTTKLIDLPGLNQVNLPNFQRFKNAFKVPSVYKKGVYNSQYESINGPSFLSFSGLFYMQFPQGIYQYKNLTNIKPLKLRPDKLVELETDAEAGHLDKSLVDQFLVNPTTKLQKFYIPPFYGKIDLVIKNFGYIEITPTGAKTSNDLIEVLVPSSLEIPMIVRKPLVTYTHKTLSGRDSKGNVLKSENKWKSTKVINHYTGGTISSELVPDIGGSHASVTAVTGLEYNEQTVISNNNDTDFWRFQ